MCGLYGDIYDPSGLTIITGYLDGIRALCGNPRPEVVSNEAISAARASASERMERCSRRYNVGHTASEVEMYNLMSMGVNLFASVYLMAPMNDKVQVREINHKHAVDICNDIKIEDPSDVAVDPTEPIVGSEFATSYLNNTGESEPFIVTKYGWQEW